MAILILIASPGSTERQSSADHREALRKGVPCLQCHQEYYGLFQQPMTVRSAEKAFVRNTLGELDPGFFRKNCRSCHVDSCRDCHRIQGGEVLNPDSRTCLECHRGYFVGPEYLGLAPREDSVRYQRGPELQGRHYLKMVPDVHAESGMQCGDCHSMQSLARGETSSAQCRDCHDPDPKVREHSIQGHMESLECYACHSAWCAQEYGTFYLRLQNATVRRYFHLRPWGSKEYEKSAYLKQQGPPPLALNSEGRVSPVRPQFIAYYTHGARNGTAVVENSLLAARWKTLFPHTVRRATVMCDNCHHNPKRFLLQEPEDRIRLPDRDGLKQGSFWDRRGQSVTNGSFFPKQRYRDMSEPNMHFIRKYVDKWNDFAPDEESSSD